MNTKRCLRRISIWCFIRKQEFAAEDFHERLKIPFIELRRLYQMDKIENQYRALGQVLVVAFDQEQYKNEASRAVEQFRKVCPDASLQ